MRGGGTTATYLWLKPIFETYPGNALEVARVMGDDD
jgi:hypothetical protein